MRGLVEDDPQAAAHFGPILDTAPEPDPAYEWVWRAWWTLNAGDRPHQVTGMASLGGAMIRSVPTSLPWSVIQRWIEVHDLSAWSAELLQHCLAMMDKVYLEWWREAAEADVNAK